MRPSRAGLLLFVVAAAFAAKPAPKPKGPPLTPEQKAALAIVKKLSLADQVAQLVIAVCYGDTYSTKSPEYQRYRHLVADLHIGGLIVNNTTQYGLVRYAEPHAMVVFLNQMQKLAKTPLIVAGDFERSASMRVSGSARFPYAMAFGAAGDPDNARFEGATAALEARALGVQWIFAPVADVNVNPENPVINVRSFGEDPDQVSRLVTAFIDGAHSDPNSRILVTVKHFPGHGDTASNSHVDLPELAVTRERMNSVEFKPFQAAIEHHVDSVMIAHMTVPAIDQEGLPATLSPAVLKTLRQDLKFDDLVVTDAMDMAGVLKQFSPSESAVRAIAAGEDILLMPPDPERAIRAVVAAANSGRIPRARIEQSAMRMIAAKMRVGLMKKKLTDLDAIPDALDVPDTNQRVQKISDQAVTLVKNDNNLLPLAKSSHPCLIVMREARASTTGLRLAQEVQARAPAAKVLVVDSGLPLAALDAAASETSGCSAMIVETSITGSDSRTSMTLAGDLGPFVEHLTNGQVPVALVSLGSPYVIASFPKSAAYLATMSPTVPSEVSAAKALFGDIPIQGHLPVTIPGIATLGEGIQLPLRSR